MEPYKPKPLKGEPTRHVVSVALSPELLRELDRIRGTHSRSRFVGLLIRSAGKAVP